MRHLGFESNQSGIETEMYSFMLVDLPGLNRTRVELKRPAHLPGGDWSLRFESNQSGIETLSSLSLAFRRVKVWIEPEGNWNVAWYTVGCRASTVWIEPEWNWNRGNWLVPLR